jgi:transporter family protein
MKTAMLLAIIILAGALGDVYIAKGMKQVGEIRTLRLRELAWLGRRMVSNMAFLLGLLAMIAGFLAFLVVLSWADLSFIIPATSLNFVLATLGAKVILKENINRLRWLGTVLVGLGVALVSLP